MRGLLRHQVLMSAASASIFGLSIVSCFTSQLYFSTFFIYICKNIIACRPDYSFVKAFMAHVVALVDGNVGCRND